MVARRQRWPVPPDHPDSYYSVARRLSKEIPNAILANQYHNPDNPAAHYETTGPEIWADFGSSLDIYFAGLGTGGTFCGTAQYLKEKNPKIKNVGIDPLGSLYYGLIREKKPSPVHPYLIEGVGEDFGPFLTVTKQNAAAAVERAKKAGVAVDARGEHLRICADILNSDEELQRAAKILGAALDGR